MLFYKTTSILQSVQKDIDALNKIAELVEKYELNADKNNFKKGKVWDEIHADYVKQTNIKIDKKALKTKWNNKVSKLHIWKRKIQFESKTRTGKY